MNWLSKSAEVLIAKCTDPGREVPKVDVAVVGSGYGGAVAALRFAAHGQSVYVLERGEEYVSGDFPNDLSQIGKHVRSEVATASGVTAQGYEGALFDFRIGLRAGALVGNGLGGGSLINAGVGLKPDEAVFRQADWPAALRQEKEFDKWFAKARCMHELQTPGQPVPGCTQPLNILTTKKYQRMQELAGLANARINKNPNNEGTKVEFYPAPIAVQLNSPAPQDLGPREPCIGCGDCVTGCNNKAKLTLTSTYLPQAFKAGAEMFTGLTVLYVSYDQTGDPEYPWLVHFLRTAERKLQHELQQQYKGTASNANSPSAKTRVYTLRARRVVLGAGAFGSTEIMLRSRDKGLSLSNTALGIGVSGNGDDVSMAYDLKEAANSMGQGSRVETQPPTGPTISSYIRFKDPDDVRRGTLIQDGAIPGLMRGVVHELLTSLGMLAQMGNLRFRKHGGRDWLALDPKVLERCLTLLGMGHDTAGGVMVFDRKTDRMGWGWPTADKETTPALHKGRQKNPIEKMGGLYIQNPAVNALPDSMSSALSGPKAGGGLFTVHPIGGCRMSDNAVTGVVNHWGAAWTADGEPHDGLYVMDGSTIPSSLGANPMLTITALAERACSLILKGMNAGHRRKLDLPLYPDCIKPLQIDEKVHSSAKLAEVLRGTMTVQPAIERENLPTALQSLTRNNAALSAALFMEFGIEDWQAFFNNPDHEVTVGCTPVDPFRQSYTSARLVLEIPLKNRLMSSVEPPVVLTVTGGKVNFFCQRHDSWCTSTGQWVRTARTYWAYRWGPDWYRLRHPTPTPTHADVKASKTFFVDFKKFLNYVVGAAKLIGHASEVREFRYALQLVDKDKNPYTLTGTKTIQAAATCEALKEWRVARKKNGGWPVLQRRSLWQQISEVDMTLSAVTDDPETKPVTIICRGRLSMDIPDMLRRVMPSIGSRRDSLNALLELAGYPLFLMRAMLKMRLLDFKLPDYRECKDGKPDLPDTDPAAIAKPKGFFELEKITYPDLPHHPEDKACKAIKAGEPILLEVPLTWPKCAGDDVEMIRLGLVRYPQKHLKCVEEGGLRRVKSIVLLNGFDLSTKPFVAKELNGIDGGNLATQLHHAGWDVWLFEYRSSPLLDASALFSNMDDIAAFDIPGAVKYIIKAVSSELGLPEMEDKTQIFAFTHCVGSASMAMSMLGGYLRHGKDGPAQLAGVLFSQYHPFVVGSATAQTRLQLAAFLHNALKLDSLQFTAGIVKADLIYSLMDRLFASAHYAQKGEPEPYLHDVHSEICPGDHDLRDKRPDSTTCKRMTGLLSRLFEHDQLLPETHEKLDDYFGRSNLGVYLHGAKCVEYERLVNADGQNVYLTDDAIRANLDMPLMFLHGEKNVLFDKASWERTLTQIVRVFSPDRSRELRCQLDVKPGVDVDFSVGNTRALRVADHAHFDCTIGRLAPKRIFERVSNFFDNAFAGVSAKTTGQPRCRARLARTGPVVGWVRPGPGNTTLIRVWIEVDDDHTDKSIAALTVVNAGNFKKVQAWRIQKQSLSSKANAKSKIFDASIFAAQASEPSVVYAVADIELPDGHMEEVTIEMVSIHQYHGPIAVEPPRGGYPPTWGVPLTREELLGLPADEDDMNVSKPGGAESRQTGRRPGRVHGTDQPLTHITLLNNARLNALLADTLHTSFLLSDQPEKAAQEDMHNRVHGPADGRQHRQVQPLDIPEDQLDPIPLISVLEADIRDSNRTAVAAEPGTLSRQRRTLRVYQQRVIKLKKNQLQVSGSGSLTFFAAACRHPGLTGFEFDRADASLSEAVKTIEAAGPRFMLMLGDQIYADARAGVLDTQSPIEKLLPRYRSAFGSSRSFRALASRLPLYMVMDDHEIDDDWSRDQQNASAASHVLASNAINAFRVFQYAHGPGAPVDPTEPGKPVQGFNYSYTCAGLPFIVLDTRTQRIRSAEPRILHASQWRWLEALLLAEQKKGSHPKFVISGSVLAPGLKEHSGYPAPRTADNWQMSPGDRGRLLSFIAHNDIENVVFISSDYHCSAAATITFTKSRVKAWAIVAPPIHAPMRFANAEANKVLPHERIPLARGMAQVDSQAWDGDGWLECVVVPTRAKVHEIKLGFHLRRLEEKDWPFEPEIRKWTLRASGKYPG